METYHCGIGLDNFVSARLFICGLSEADSGRTLSLPPTPVCRILGVRYADAPICRDKPHAIATPNMETATPTKPRMRISKNSNYDSRSSFVLNMGCSKHAALRKIISPYISAMNIVAASSRARKISRTRSIGRPRRGQDCALE